ncbi:MAG: 4-oxalocrotonate tautomerase family protein [candidate division WS1 bacterium]|jgi:4-oxalocrotonate tautomerase|nr:4-oxalocrotonate tautomerase family protein [candidate division WS1 bacterium]
MPVVQIDGGPLSVEKKRELCGNITEALSTAYGLPKSAYIILIRENTGENVGVGGELLCDRH